MVGLKFGGNRPIWKLLGCFFNFLSTILYEGLQDIKAEVSLHMKKGVHEKFRDVRQVNKGICVCILTLQYVSYVPFLISLAI